MCDYVYVYAYAHIHTCDLHDSKATPFKIINVGDLACHLLRPSKQGGHGSLKLPATLAPKPILTTTVEIKQALNKAKDELICEVQSLGLQDFRTSVS